MEGAPKIVVHLTEQRAFFYKGKTLVGQSSISTGRKGFETPPGKYRVIQKDENHVSNLYGSYVDPDGTWCGAMWRREKLQCQRARNFEERRCLTSCVFGGYGMHAGFVPRYRASHGCIRMPREMAQHFFDAAEEDTPVIVKE